MSLSGTHHSFRRPLASVLPSCIMYDKEMVVTSQKPPELRNLLPRIWATAVYSRRLPTLVVRIRIQD